MIDSKGTPFGVGDILASEQVPTRNQIQVVAISNDIADMEWIGFWDGGTGFRIDQDSMSHSHWIKQ